MEYLWIITLLAAIQFLVFGAFVGAARAKTGVQAPAMSGDEYFERRFRVHYNTLEQIVVFYPGLWAFGLLLSSTYAAAIGIVYLIGRLIYFVQYTNRPESRGAGFLLTVVPNFVLLLGGLTGAALRLLNG